MIPFTSHTTQRVLSLRVDNPMETGLANEAIAPAFGHVQSAVLT